MAITLASPLFIPLGQELTALRPVSGEAKLGSSSGLGLFVWGVFDGCTVQLQVRPAQFDLTVPWFVQDQATTQSVLNMTYSGAVSFRWVLEGATPNTLIRAAVASG